MNALLKFLERTSLLVGITLIALAGFTWFGGVAHSRSAVADFEQIKDMAIPAADQRNWSEQRKAAYQHALSKEAGDTLAILRIESAGIEVPVFDSTSKTALNRGSGHVAGTALPGTHGNTAIAGHRDGFFRGLKNISVGAEIELSTLHGQQKFRVAEILIVDPLDVSVLNSADETMITLITCYPFYFVGPAPERFIVRATLI
jgi:sortase A